MAKGKLKKPQSSGAKGRLRVPEEVDYQGMPVVFSLERLVGDKYCLSHLDQEHRAHFAHAIFKRRNTTWKEIQTMARHALGCEKIAVSSIRVPKPVGLTDDVTHYLAFRYKGLAPVVGYRKNNVFYVLWFDHNFTLYDHG